MPKNRAIEPVREIKYYCYLKDLPRLFKHHEKLVKYIDEGKDIPYRLLQNYFKLLHDSIKHEVSVKEQLKREKELNNVHLALLRFFEDKPQYRFSFKKEWGKKRELEHIYNGEEVSCDTTVLDPAPAKFVTRKYSFDYTLEHFFSHLFALLKHDWFYPATQDKRELIQFVYLNLTEYLDEAEATGFTKYATCVVTGAVVAEFGLLPSESQYKRAQRIKSRSQGYFEFLYDSVKYTVKIK